MTLRILLPKDGCGKELSLRKTNHFRLRWFGVFGPVCRPVPEFQHARTRRLGSLDVSEIRLQPRHLDARSIRLDPAGRPLDSDTSVCCQKSWMHRSLHQKRRRLALRISPPIMSIGQPRNRLGIRKICSAARKRNSRHWSCVLEQDHFFAQVNPELNLDNHLQKLDQSRSFDSHDSNMHDIDPPSGFTKHASTYKS